MAKLGTLKAQRKTIKAAITRFTNAFEDYDQSSGLGAWRTTLEKLKPYFDKYEVWHALPPLRVMAAKRRLKLVTT